jgi:hypothetical protein
VFNQFAAYRDKKLSVSLCVFSCAASADEDEDVCYPDNDERAIFLLKELLKQLKN